MVDLGLVSFNVSFLELYLCSIKGVRNDTNIE